MNDRKVREFGRESGITSLKRRNAIKAHEKN